MATDTTALAHLCSFTCRTPAVSQHIPEHWATQLQIPDGRSCKRNSSTARKGASEGWLILMNDVLVLQKKKHCAGKFSPY